jgi:hypothetical protein
MRKLHRLWHFLKLIAHCGRTGKPDIVLKTGKPELDLTLFFFREVGPASLLSSGRRHDISCP